MVKDRREHQPSFDSELWGGGGTKFVWGYLKVAKNDKCISIYQ